MQLLKEVQGLYNPWEKSLFLSHHWRHWYYGLYLVCDTWSWLCCWRMWSCLQRPKGSSLLWEAGLEQAADNSNLVCLKGMLFKYVLTIKYWHSFIQGTPPSEFLQTRPDSPILFDPHYLCCYLCCVVADTFASLEWQHQNHYLCSSRKSFSLVAILIRKRLKEWKEQNLDLPVSQSLPQVPGFPFSGVQSPSLHLSLKAPSPWAGCKALELLLFQSHGLQQQHSILHIKVLACCVWTHSQAPWLEKQTFSTQWLFQFLLPWDWKDGEDFIQAFPAWLNFARKDLFSLIPHFHHTKYERSNRLGCKCC